MPLIGKVSLAPPFDLKNLPCIHLCMKPAEDPYPLCKLWRQRVLSKNVKLDPLEAEQEGRFDHGEGLVQTIPTGHHSQMHDLLRPCALGHGPSPVTKHIEDAGMKRVHNF